MILVLVVVVKNIKDVVDSSRGKVMESVRLDKEKLDKLKTNVEELGVSL